MSSAGLLLLTLSSKRSHHEEEIFYTGGGDSKEQAAQGAVGCLILGNIQSHVGQGFEQLALLEDVPAHGSWLD